MTKHRHGPAFEPEVIEDCIVSDATYANWLLAHQMDKDFVLDMRALQDAWRAGWVEGVIRERFREHKLGPLPPP